MFETADKHGFHFDTVADAHQRDGRAFPFVSEWGLRQWRKSTAPRFLAMKTFGDPYILQSNTVTPMEALHFGLNLPGVGWSSPGNRLLQQSSIRRSRPSTAFRPLDQQQVRRDSRQDKGRRDDWKV